MTNKAETQPEVKDYAGGWISERKHTEVPAFLKFSYVVIALCATSYLVVFMNGETGHAERGSLVEQFNRATMSSPALMYGVAALVAVFFLGVILFAFRSTEGHD